MSPVAALPSIVSEKPVLTSSTGVTTTSTVFQPSTSAKCTLPASVSGKAYSVTPVIWVPRTVSSTAHTTSYSCDPIPAASINKGNFQFACKSLLGKDVGTGVHTISWNLPTAAGISIEPYYFNAGPPTSTPVYVVNTALASTTLVPTTVARLDATTPSTKTLVSTSTRTATSTCLVTVTVAPVSGPPLRRAGSANLQPDAELLESDSVAVDVDTGYDLAHENGNDDSTDMVMDLKERAAALRTPAQLAASDRARLAAAQLATLRAASLQPATPTIGKPDFTYPPYSMPTVYVKSLTTSFWTSVHVSTVWVTPTTPTTTTVTCTKYTSSTVTVTRTPVTTVAG